MDRELTVKEAWILYKNLEALIAQQEAAFDLDGITRYELEGEKLTVEVKERK